MTIHRASQGALCPSLLAAQRAGSPQFVEATPLTHPEIEEAHLALAATRLPCNIRQTPTIMTERENHLRLIEIFHYVVGGLAGTFAMFPTIHLVIGLMLVFSPQSFDGQGEAPPPFVGWMFVMIAAVFITLGLALACCIIAAGRSIRKRRRYMFCLVMAGVECMFMPFGTVLGVFTILLLVKEDVKRMFPAGSPPTVPQSFSS